jgi:hypothetical protein
MHLQVLVDQLGERDRRRSPAGPEPLENLLKRLQCIGTAGDPPTCGLADPRPSRRYRYARSGWPSVAFARNLNT